MNGDKAHFQTKKTNGAQGDHHHGYKKLLTSSSNHSKEFLKGEIERMIGVLREK